MARRWIVVVVVLVVAVGVWWIASSVLNSNEAQIKRTIAGAAKALNERNLPMFLAFISKDYNDQYGHASREALGQSIEAMSKLIKAGSIQVKSIKVKLTGDKAEATFFVWAQVAADGSPETEVLGQTGSTERLRLLLKKEPDGWRITNGQRVESTIR